MVFREVNMPKSIITFPELYWSLNTELQLFSVPWSHVPSCPKLCCQKDHSGVALTVYELLNRIITTAISPMETRMAQKCIRDWRTSDWSGCLEVICEFEQIYVKQEGNVGIILYKVIIHLLKLIMCHYEFVWLLMLVFVMRRTSPDQNNAEGGSVYQVFVILQMKQTLCVA